MEEKDEDSSQGDLYGLNQMNDKTNDFYNYDFENIEQNKIESQKSSTSNQNKNLINNNKLDLLNISEIKYENEESSDNKSYNDLLDKIPLEKMIELSNYIIQFYEKKINPKKTVVRCFNHTIGEKRCFCIPIIIKTLYGMKFSCDNQNFKDLEIKDIIDLILNNKLFVEKVNASGKVISIDDKPKNEIKESQLGIKFKKKILFGSKIIQKAAHDKFLINNKKLKRKINRYRKISLNSHDENQIKKIERKIRNCFFDLSRYINNFIYCLIIKNLIKESFGKIDEDKNLDNLKINLEKAIEVFKISRLQEKNESLVERETLMNSKSSIDFQGKKYKPRWIIPFHIKEDIENNIVEIIFVAISSDGYIFIYLLNIAVKINDDLKYKIIVMKDLKLLKNQEKIVKFKNLINSSNMEEKNNYFLISSYHEHKAIIINISEIREKPEIPLEEKYKIEIFQKIEFDFGLYSSIEIEHFGNNYLLNYHNNFNIWIYNENKNQVEYKEIKVNKLTKDNDLGERYHFGPLIQGQNKNLIIAQIAFPISRIEIYNIDESNKDLCLIQKGYICLNEEDNYFSRQNNNYYLYKDEYLLLASIQNKNTERNGGIYIFDIKKFIKINYVLYDNIISFNCFLGINENTLICSTEMIYKKKSKNNKEGVLYSLNIEEKNNSLILNLKEDKKINGEYKYIDCENFIYKSYFSSSSMKNNCIVRIDKNNEFTHNFNIYDHDNFKKQFYYFNLDSNC